VFSLSWIAFGVMLLLMWRFAGLGHPPPLNDYERLGPGRLAIAAVAAVMLVVSFTPTLVYFGDLLPGVLETVRAAF
jgi:hypothetical protein